MNTLKTDDRRLDDVLSDLANRFHGASLRVNLFGSRYEITRDGSHDRFTLFPDGRLEKTR